MRNLLQILLRYHLVLLFIILEIVCFSMISRYNNYQRIHFFNSTNSVIGGTYSSIQSVKDYFTLGRVNKELQLENAQLRKLLANTEVNNDIIDSVATAPIELDSSLISFIPARIVNNTINSPFNYITLQAGSKDGVQSDMGVISNNCIVGVVRRVSENYSSVISLLNSHSRISAKIKRNNYYGSLKWDGKDYRQSVLSEIPFHVDLNIGDTIVHTGFGDLFPENTVIGTIKDYTLEGGSNFYRINVELAADFKNLSNVQIIDNSRRKEQQQLESLEER